MKKREFICYLCIGGSCAASQNAVIIVLCWMGHPYLAANLFSALIIVPVGYILQSTLTFRVIPNLFNFLRFAIGVAIGLVLSSMLLWITHGLCALPIEIASPAVTALMTIYGFLLSRGISRSTIRRSPADAHERADQTVYQ